MYTICFNLNTIWGIQGHLGDTNSCQTAFYDILSFIQGNKKGSEVKEQIDTDNASRVAVYSSVKRERKKSQHELLFCTAFQG